MNAVPVYFELDAGVDHDAIERELDAQMGIAPRPPRWRPTGPVLCCQHVHITVSTSAGLTDVVCEDCGHEWLTVEGA